MTRRYRRVISQYGWSLALPTAPIGSIGYAGHWRTKEDAEAAFADPSSKFYGGCYNGIRGRLTHTMDWRDDEAAEVS